MTLPPSYCYVSYQELCLAHCKYPVSVDYYFINLCLSPQYIAALANL